MQQFGFDRTKLAKNLSVRLNDGTAVVGDTDVTIMPGERVLIAGDSGSGKSTLVRAIAGLWPWGGGSVEISVEIKRDAKMFLLPQRPYIPIGTLRRAATYPDAANSKSIEEVAEAFKRVGLAHLVDKLEEDAPWDQTLSGGEKQRVAFARILLHKPDIVVLDEATSALDPKSQVRLMELLTDHPKITYSASAIAPSSRPSTHARSSLPAVARVRSSCGISSWQSLLKTPCGDGCAVGPASAIVRAQPDAQLPRQTHQPHPRLHRAADELNIRARSD